MVQILALTCFHTAISGSIQSTLLDAGGKIAAPVCGGCDPRPLAAIFPIRKDLGWVRYELCRNVSNVSIAISLATPSN